MEERDDQLTQQVHDAFDSVTMSDEAQQRVLGNLLARQEQLAGSDTSFMEVPETTVMPRAQGERVATGGHMTEVVPMPKKKSMAMWLLPLAAVILAGLVVVRIVMPTNESARMNMKSDAMVAAESDAGSADSQVGEVRDEDAEPTYTKEELGIEEDAEEEAFDGAPTEDVLPEPEESGPLGTVDLYPIVVMDDGTVLSALIDGVYTQQLDVSQVSDSLGSALAHPSDAEQTVACEVFKLADEAQGFAVRYEGEDTYWYCVQVGAPQ